MCQAAAPARATAVSILLKVYMFHPKGNRAPLPNQSPNTKLLRSKLLLIIDRAKWNYTTPLWPAFVLFAMVLQPPVQPPVQGGA